MSSKSPDLLTSVFNQIGIVIGLMTALFVFLQLVIPTSLVQPVGTIAAGFILTMALVLAGKWTWNAAGLTWAGTSIVLLIVHLVVSQPAALTGIAVRSDGTPLGNVTLTITNSSGIDQKAVTDKDGKFQVNGVPEGPYSITSNGTFVYSGIIPSGWQRVFEPMVNTGTHPVQIASVSTLVPSATPITTVSTTAPTASMTGTNTSTATSSPITPPALPSATFTITDTATSVPATETAQANLNQSKTAALWTSTLTLTLTPTNTVTPTVTYSPTPSPTLTLTPMPTLTLTNSPVPAVMLTATSVPIPTLAQRISKVDASVVGWQSTDVTINAGARVKIIVTEGSWTTQKGVQSYTQGQGGTYRCGYAEAASLCLEPMPYEPSGSLIGKIGNQQFGVGSGTTISAQQSGVLYLAMNDSPTGFYDNDGILAVTITVEG